jgi:Asp/Glu/hydantoin racemase
MVDNLTDHDLLLRIDERQVSMQKDISELKERDKMRKCPAQQCDEHRDILEVHETNIESLDKRISKMEDHEKIVVAAVVVGIIGSGLLVWILGYLTGT